MPLAVIKKILVLGVILICLYSIVSNIRYILYLKKQSQQLKKLSSKYKKSIEELESNIEKQEKEIYNIKLNNAHHIYPEKEKHGTLLIKIVNLNYMNHRLKSLKKFAESDESKFIKRFRKEKLKTLLFILFYIAIITAMILYLRGNIDIYIAH